MPMDQFRTLTRLSTAPTRRLRIGLLHGTRQFVLLGNARAGHDSRLGQLGVRGKCLVPGILQALHASQRRAVLLLVAPQQQGNRWFHQ